MLPPFCHQLTDVCRLQMGERRAADDRAEVTLEWYRKVLRLFSARSESFVER